MLEEIRIATRSSNLALWQAHFVKTQLETAYPTLRVHLVPIVSKGDKLLDAPLAKIGGKGLFVKELEAALINNEADIAVHSLKDVPMEFPKGLMLTCICKREDPRDAFLSPHYQTLEELPQGSIVGTSSLRRQAQLLALRPDLTIRFLRGNINTRLSKLDKGDYDAIILAAAGLIRLKLNQKISTFLPIEQSLPAVGQGAIGVECRSDDLRIQSLLAPFNDQQATLCVTAERAMNKHLNGGCQVPIGGYALIHNQHLYLRGLVGTPDGQCLLKAEATAPLKQAKELGVDVAEQLLNQGAGKILDQLYHQGS